MIQDYTPEDYSEHLLEQKFASDVRRIRYVLRHTQHANLADAVLSHAWKAYSESLHAVWTTLPEDDDQLRDIVMQHLTSHVRAHTRPIAWRTTLVDASDDSGDAFLELSTDVLGRLGWKVGDIVTITPGEQGCLAIGKSRIKDR